MRVAAPRRDHRLFECPHVLDVLFYDLLALVVREPSGLPEAVPEPCIRPVGEELEVSSLLEPRADVLKPRRSTLLTGRRPGRKKNNPHHLLPLRSVEDVARELEHAFHSQLRRG